MKNKKNLLIKKNIFRTIKVLSIFLLVSIPVLSLSTDFSGAVTNVVAYSQKTINLFIGIAVIFFFWGVIVMVSSPDNSKAKETSKTRLVWGVVIIFVLFTIWSILEFVTTTTKLDNTKIDVDLKDLPASIDF